MWSWMPASNIVLGSAYQTTFWFHDRPHWVVGYDSPTTCSNTVTFAMPHLQYRILSGQASVEVRDICLGDITMNTNGGKEWCKLYMDAYDIVLCCIDGYFEAAPHPLYCP